MTGQDYNSPSMFLAMTGLQFAVHVIMFSIKATQDVKGEQAGEKKKISPSRSPFFFCIAVLRMYLYTHLPRQAAENLVSVVLPRQAAESLVSVVLCLRAHLSLLFGMGGSWWWWLSVLSRGMLERVIAGTQCEIAWFTSQRRKNIILAPAYIISHRCGWKRRYRADQICTLPARKAERGRVWDNATRLSVVERWPSRLATMPGKERALRTHRYYIFRHFILQVKFITI